MGKLCQGISWINMRMGHAMGWLMLALVLLVTGDVISRYFFSTGAVVIQEAEWWMFSIIFLLCAGYTALYNEHVRVDLIYSKLPRKWQNITDLVLAFVFLFPLCIMLIGTSFWYIRDSWAVGEISADPGGMCCYYVLKAMIPLGFFLLMLQGVVQIHSIIRELQGHPREPPLKGGFAARSLEIAAKKD